MRNVQVFVALVWPSVAEGIVLHNEKDRHLRRHPPWRKKGLPRSKALPNGAKASTQGDTLIEDAVEASQELQKDNLWLVRSRRLASAVDKTNSVGLAIIAVLGVLVMLLCFLLGCLLVQFMKSESREDFLEAVVRPVGALAAPPRLMSRRAGGGAAPSGGSYEYSRRGGLRSLFAPFAFSPPEPRTHVPRSLLLNKPSPVCPELVVAIESLYVVNFKDIDSASGPVPIYGRGKKLTFTAQILKTGAAGHVKLTMGDDRGVQGSIISTAGSLVIQDKHERQYGELHNVGRLAYSLRCGGVEAMRMTTDTPFGRVLLVNPADKGTQLATAFRVHDTSDLPTPEDHLGISVVAGMDPVLTILCVIGAMALSS